MYFDAIETKTFYFVLKNLVLWARILYFGAFARIRHAKPLTHHLDACKKLETIQGLRLAGRQPGFRSPAP